MLVIRLQRTGKKNAAAYRVVLAEKQKAVGGKIIETLGFHNPRTKENAFKDERIKYWLSQGAKALPTVHNLLVEKKIIEGKKVKAWTPKKKPSSASATEDKPAVAEGSGVAMPAAEASSSAKAAEDTVGEAKPVTEEKPVEGAAKPVEEAAEPEAKAEEPVSSDDKSAEEKKKEKEVKEEKPVEDEAKTEETK